MRSYGKSTFIVSKKNTWHFVILNILERKKVLRAIKRLGHTKFEQFYKGL